MGAKALAILRLLREIPQRKARIPSEASGPTTLDLWDVILKILESNHYATANKMYPFKLLGDFAPFVQKKRMENIKNFSILLENI